MRGLSFFHLRFLQRMILCGLLGMTVFLLLPLLVVISGKMPMTFWETLEANLVPQYSVLKLYFFYGLHPMEHLEFLALLLAYLMPLAMMAIRWKSAFGDHSPISMKLTSFMFHLGCAGILIFCIWMAFDPPFSPRQLNL